MMNPLDLDLSTTRLLVESPKDSSKAIHRRNSLSPKTLRGGLYFHHRFKSDHPEYPLVTVITAEKDAETKIEDTIHSVLHQDYPNIEYIIVDGNSSEKTIELIRKYEDYVDLWISETDTGFYNAINKGILLAEGEYIHVLNADDLYLDNKTVSRFVRAFQKTQSDLVYCDTLIFDREQGGGWIRYSQLTRFHLANGGFAQQAFFYRKTLFDRIGLFDESFRIAGDYEFLMRAVLQNNVRKYYLSGPQIIFARGGISAKPHNERMKALAPYYSRWELWLFTRIWFRMCFNSVDYFYRIGRFEWFIRKIFHLWTT